MRRAMRWAGLPAVLLAVACSESTTAPETAVEDAELAAFEAAVLPGGRGAGMGAHYLPALLRQAVEEVRAAEGDEAAAALTAPLRALLEEGRAIRDTGDRDAFRAHMEEVRAATAAIVIEVLGAGVVDGALADAAAAIAALEARIAEGGAPALAAQKLAQAESAYEAALAAQSAGDAIAALSEAAHAIEIATNGPPPRRRGGRMGR